MAKKNASTTIDTSGYDYTTLRLRGKDGKLRYSRGNNDAVHRATAMHTKVNLKDIMQVARANKLEIGDYPNSGQVSMAVGNKLRALVRAGTPVTVGDIVVKKLDQQVRLPEEPEGKAAPAKAKRATRRTRAAPAPEEATAG